MNDGAADHHDVPTLEELRADMARLIRELQMFHALLLGEPNGLVEQQRQQQEDIHAMQASVKAWDARLDERMDEKAADMREELAETIRQIRAHVQQVTLDLERRMRQRVDDTMGPIAKRELKRQETFEKLKTVALEGAVKTMAGLVVAGVVGFIVYLITLWIKAS